MWFFKREKDIEKNIAVVLEMVRNNPEILHNTKEIREQLNNIHSLLLQMQMKKQRITITNTKKEVLKVLKKRQEAGVRELMLYTGVSRATLYRILEELLKEKKVKRIKRGIYAIVGK